MSSTTEHDTPTTLSGWLTYRRIDLPLAVALVCCGLLSLFVL